MKYICEHSIPNDTEKRVYTLSANDKLDYLVSVINECGISVEIISASRTKAKNGNAHPRQHNELNGEEKRGGHDRRKESHPALLDTRLTKRREDRAGPPTINFEA